MSFKFRKIRSVTLELFKWKNDIERYFKITSEMFKGQELTPKEGEKAQDPVTLVNCVDLETGEEGQFIVGAVLLSTWETDEMYQNGNYVGKCFAITQKRDPSKKYNTYIVIEIDADEVDEAGETGDMFEADEVPKRSNKK